MSTDLLPYYLRDTPMLDDEPQPNAPTIRRRRTKRPLFWAASLGLATMAGHSYQLPTDVRAWLKGVGFTEILTTRDAADIAPIVADLREAFRAGHRADKF